MKRWRAVLYDHDWLEEGDFWRSEKIINSEESTLEEVASMIVFWYCVVLAAEMREAAFELAVLKICLWMVSLGFEERQWYSLDGVLA